MTSWDVQPSTVNIDHIIYFFNTGEVFNNKIAGGYFSTEGITLFINQNKNVFSLDKVRVDIPWNEMTEIKIVNYTTDPDPESFAQIFTQFGSQLASAFETLTEAPKPWVVINRQHVISFFGCGYPTVGELCAFFNEIANCKCEIIGDEE